MKVDEKILWIVWLVYFCAVELNNATTLFMKFQKEEAHLLVDSQVD